MLLFVETQSAQNIFVNQWCAINGQVLFFQSFNFVFGVVNSVTKVFFVFFFKEEECII